MPAVLDLQPCQHYHISDHRYPHDFNGYEALVHLDLNEPNASEVFPGGVDEY